MSAWRREAEGLGISVQELLEERIQDKSGSDYPTPLCLTPLEATAHMDPRTLGTERERHVAECPGCTNLISMLERVQPLERPTENDPEYALHRDLMRHMQTAT